MKVYRFVNEQIIPIDNGPANQISSSIVVQETAGMINDINLKLDIKHSYTEDLEIRLLNPDGVSVRLVRGVGGSDNDFHYRLWFVYRPDDGGLVTFAQQIVRYPSVNIIPYLTNLYLKSFKKLVKNSKR